MEFKVKVCHLSVKGKDYKEGDSLTLISKDLKDPSIKRLIEAGALEEVKESE